MRGHLGTPSSGKTVRSTRRNVKPRPGADVIFDRAGLAGSPGGKDHRVPDAHERPGGVSVAVHDPSAVWIRAADSRGHLADRGRVHLAAGGRTGADTPDI